jgi:hypothetical protein
MAAPGRELPRLTAFDGLGGIYRAGLHGVGRAVTAKDAVVNVAFSRHLLVGPD